MPTDDPTSLAPPVGLVPDLLPEDRIFATLLFLRFREEVSAAVQGSRTLRFYTPHGLSHINGVEETTGELLGLHGRTALPTPRKLQPITDLERLLLRFSAWGHDLGMIEEVARRYGPKGEGQGTGEVQRNRRLRRQHDRISANYVRSEIPGLFWTTRSELLKGRLGTTKEQCLEDLRSSLQAELPAFEDEEITDCLRRLREDEPDRWETKATNLAYAVNLVAQYHRRAEPIDECPETRMLFDRPVRAKLLAAVFRLADALHVDRSRFSRHGFDISRELPDFDEESRMHWIRSFIVSSIHIDTDRHTVCVQADLPYGGSGSDAGRQAADAASLQEMLNFIHTDLEEDVVSVSRILVQNHFPPLLGVSIETHPIPAMEYPKDIRAALHHVLAASSPNTSQLITIALDALEAALDELDDELGDQPDLDGAKEGALVAELDRRLRSIRQHLERRPCHEGLHKIRDLLVAVQELWAPREPVPLAKVRAVFDQAQVGRSRLLWTLLEGVFRVFERQRDAVRQGAGCPGFSSLLEGCSDIVLYGFSSQVISLLAHFFVGHREHQPRVHILECRTKTLYSPTGHLLYLDAHRYARHLREELRQPVELTIVPDVALGRILRGEGGKKVILLGSNAVYPGGEFVHSMGHLTVASVAKSPAVEGTCEVVVLTDTMKLGSGKPLEDDYKEPRERNEERWLTHNRSKVDELVQRKVALHNWQEDRVPGWLVDKLLVLDRQEVLEQDGFDALEDLAFRPRDRYADELETRLLAALLAHQEAPPPAARAIADTFPDVRKPDLDWALADRFVTARQRAGGAPAEGGAEPAEGGRPLRGAAVELHPDIRRWIRGWWSDEVRAAVAALAGAIREPGARSPAPPAAREPAAAPAGAG